MHSLKRKVDLVAQLVEHNTFNVGALGSSPSGITNASHLVRGILFGATEACDEVTEMVYFLSGKLFFHLLHHILLKHDLRQVYHVHDGLRAGYAMSDDHGFGYPQDRRTAIIFEIKALEKFFLYILLMTDLV